MSQRSLEVFAAAILGLCAAGVSFAEDGSRWEVSGGRDYTLGPEWPDRFRKNPKMIEIKQGTSKESIQKILLANPHKKGWSVDEDGHFNYYRLKDVKREKLEEQWHKSSHREYLVQPPIGSYRAEKESYGSSRPGRFHPVSRKAVIQRLGDGGRSYHEVTVFLVTEGTTQASLLHEIQREHVLTSGRPVSKPGGVVVESNVTSWGGPETVEATWASGQGIVVHIKGMKNSDGEAVVSAYLEKYPSSLPKNFKIDLQEWGKKELASCIKIMRDTVEEPNRRIALDPPRNFDRARSRIGRRFKISDLYSSFGRREGELYREHVAGDEWRSDYDTYWKELVKLRQEQIAEVERALERAKTGVTLGERGDSVCLVLGEDPSAAEAPQGMTPAAKSLLSVTVAVGCALLVVLGVLVATTVAGGISPPTRFPWVRALICAICIAACSWTWMRFSYAWHVTGEELGTLARKDDGQAWLRERYLLFEESVVALPRGKEVTMTAICNGMVVHVLVPPRPDGQKDSRNMAFRGPHGRMIPIPGEHLRLKSRFELTDEAATVDGFASRFHPVSIIGLGIGAMGVLVFAFALMNWMKRRRAGAGVIEGAQPADGTGSSA